MLGRPRGLDLPLHLRIDYKLKTNAILNYRDELYRQSSIQFLEVSELVGIPQALHESVEIAEVGLLRHFVLHPASQHIGNRIVLVEDEAEFAIDPPEH
jgi:hypothetical protein